MNDQNENTAVKEIPYGIADYERIRTENYYYVDKTIGFFYRGFDRALQTRSKKTTPYKGFSPNGRGLTERFSTDSIISS